MCKQNLYKKRKYKNWTQLRFYKSIKNINNWFHWQQPSVRQYL